MAGGRGVAGGGPGETGSGPHLAGVALFADLGAAELARLERLGRRRRYGPGDVIVRQGESGIALFVVLAGRVRITQRGPDGAERELRVLGPGGSFGEIALLSGRTRTATASALEPVECLALLRLDFLEELRREPEIAIRLLATVSGRLEEAERRA